MANDTIMSVIMAVVLIVIGLMIMTKDGEPRIIYVGVGLAIIGGGIYAFFKTLR